MANEIKFVLSADGSGLKVVVDGAAKSLDSLAQSGSKSAEKLSAGFTSSFADIGKASIVFSAVSAAASAVVNVMAQLPTSGIQFAASLETTRIGMAGILASMTAVDGKATSFAQGLAIASDMTAKLQRDAMLTAASTQELVTAFQAMVGPGLAAGMSLDQIRQLATTGVNAVKSLGMESSQVVQELRDLVQGGITPASSTLATALGLKDADIAKAKASTEGLFTFLMERMKGFTAGAEAYSTTFTGTMQQMAEQLQKSAAMAFAPLGEELKVQAKGITEALSDDANVAQFQKLTGAAQMIAQALGQTTQAAIRHSDAIVTVVQVYGTVKFGTMIAGWTASAQALMAASQASRLSAAQSAVEGVANTEVTLTARQKIAAYMAELAAKEAAAAATVAQTTAQLASLQAGIAGLELSRSEVVAKMASTRSTIAQAQAQLAAAQAAGAQSFALAMVTEATNTLTGAQVRQSALMTELALLGRQQATVSASIAVAAAAQGAATEGAALATNHLNVAQKAATVGGGAMGAVLGALGGPVGIAIAAVTLLTMKLFEMNSEATKAAVISVSKDRVDAATAQGTKAGDEELSNLTGKISELKRTKLELLAEQKSPGVMAWVFGDDYKSGLDSQLQHVEAQITGLEATTSAASAIAQSNGTQVKLQGTMALQQIDQLLDKYKTASQLSDNAKKEKAALDTQLAALKSSNASTADITAKETEVAQAKRFIEVKLQADLKAEREKGLADLQAVANASYAVEKAQAQQKVALQAQAIDTLEMQNELSFKSLLKTDANYFQAESAYYAERLALQLKSLDAQTAAVQKEMELQAKRLDVRNLRPTDRIAAEEKLIELGTKAIDLQTKRNALEGGETLRIAEKMAGFRQAQVDSDQKAFEALHGQVTALRESNAVMELHNQEIGLNQRALDALTLSRLDAGIALQQSIVDEDAYKVSLGQGTAEMQEQINKLAELNRQRGLVAIGQTKTAGAEAAKVVFEQWKHGWEETDRLARDVFTTWAEDGSNAAKKIGDTLEKALLSAIYEATLKPIAFQIYSSVAGAPSGSTASGNPLGSIAGSANGGLGGYLGSVEIAGSSLSAIGSSITTGFSAGWAGMDTAAAVEAYSAAGMTGTATGLGAGSAAGSALAAIGPVGWAILAAAAIGSQLTGGHEYTTGTGISGKFSGSGFAGSNYQTWQNDGDKLFGMSVGHSSSGTNHSALDDATSAQWAKGYAALQASAITSAQALGLSADAITSFSKDVSVALGSDAAANAKAIEAMFVGLADSMATAVAPKITELAKDGEAASVTLARLSASITTANAWLSMLRNRLFDVSMAGADAASALVDAFGGLDKFTASSRAFYEAYYSDGEKVANSQAQMTQALAQLGIALPINKDALKALAATLDMNTESGRAAYATLLQIAPEFASTADLIARAAKDAADGLLSAFVGVSIAVPALDFTALDLSLNGMAGRANAVNFTGFLNTVGGMAGGANAVNFASFLNTVGGMAGGANAVNFAGFLNTVGGMAGGANAVNFASFLNTVGGMAGGANAVNFASFLNTVGGMAGGANAVNFAGFLNTVGGMAGGANAVNFAGFLNAVGGMAGGANAVNFAGLLGSLDGLSSGMFDSQGHTVSLRDGIARMGVGLFDAGGNAISTGAAASSLAQTLTAVGVASEGFTRGVYQINAVMGDSSSGFLYLATSSGALSTGLTQSQLAAGRLNDQMALLNEVADKSRINIAGMGTALASVNTETFVSAIGLVFDNLATRIKGTIAGISSERIAVRQAALQIINPGVMSKASIQSGVAGVNTTLPGHVALDAANTALVLANSNLATVQASALSASAAASVAQTAKADAVTYYAGQNAQLRALGAAYSPAGTSIRFNATGDNNDAYNYNAATNSLNAFNSLGYSNYTNTLHQPWGDVSTTYSPDLAGMKADPRYAQLNAILSGGSAALATAASNIAKAQAVSAAAQAAITPATAEQTAAAGAAKKAALDYAAALQNFAIDASKSVTKLTSLREETVKYYEAQKQLADLMSTSAAGLRTTVADYRYAQKTPEQQVAELQGKFSSAYSLALAAQGDGATLSGYGDKINSLLGPLIDKLGETGKSNLVDSYLAQAESIAKLLEDTTPVNYQQDSLAMLGSIDQTLAALDASSQSAERIITAAINAGSDKTALGLHAVVAALTGQSIPAFEAGGHYLGGLALVGERGPELINFNQPGQIYNASQTRGMFAGGGQGGNTARLEALVERQAQQLEAITRELIALRREAAETSGNTSKMVKQADRLEVIGMPVRNASGAPLETVAAA